MKKDFIKAISLSLFAAFAAQTMTACGSSPASYAADTTALTSESESVTTEEPEVIRDLEGKNLRVYMTCDYIYQIYAESENGEVTNDAIFRRNQKICEKYNFNIEPMIAGTTGTFNVWSDLGKTALAGDDVYDLAGHYSYNYKDALANGSTLVNWLDVPNIDFDAPYWSKTINDGSTINGKLFGLSGYLSTTLMQMTYGIYFNETLVEKYGYNASGLYKTVIDGKWTIDYLGTVVKDMYVDLNGNNERDIDDQFGYASMPDNSPDFLLAAFEQPITSRDKDGRLTCVVNTEKTVDIINKMLDFYYNNPGTANLEKLTAYVTNGANKYFAEEKLVFCPSTFLAAFTTYRDMKSTYGILPPPKWDEKQEEYHTHVQDKFTAYAIPVTASDLDFIGYAVEKLCKETYESVYPAFYDVALKDKYSKDAEAAAMVDMIMEGVTFDAGWIFGSYIGSMQCCVRNAIKNNDPNFASAYAAATMKIDDLMKLYE